MEDRRQSKRLDLNLRAHGKQHQAFIRELLSTVAWEDVS